MIISGDPFLPEYNISYESFSGDVFASSVLCAAVFAFGVMAATFKKPYTAVIFITVTVVAGYTCQGTAQKALAFPPIVEQNMIRVCMESPVG